MATKKKRGAPSLFIYIWAGALYMAISFHPSYFIENKKGRKDMNGHI